MALTQTEINEVMSQLKPVIAKALSESTSIQQAQANISQGVTQYVGARYVPLFADPITWDNTRAYEPLTIVLYQGNSYTTRQYTPAGININNEAFWALTGNYNAQVEVYRQEVETFDNRITENSTAIQTLRKKRNCICIGNSFTIGYYTHNYGIGDYVKDSHFFDNTYVYGKDSSGFDNYTLGGVTINDSNNFNSMVNEAASNSDIDATSITDIIFISAMGDTRALAAKYEGGTHAPTFNNLTATIDNAKSKFPNAKIYIFFAEWLDKRNTAQSYSKTIPFMQLRAQWLFTAQNAAHYLGWGSYFANFNPAFSRYREADGYHPTKDGSILLGNMLISALSGYSTAREVNFQYSNSVDGLTAGEDNRMLFPGLPNGIIVKTSIKLPKKSVSNWATKASQRTSWVLGDGVSDTQLPILAVEQATANYTYNKNGEIKCARAELNSEYDVAEGKNYLTIAFGTPDEPDDNTSLLISASLIIECGVFAVLNA